MYSKLLICCLIIVSGCTNGEDILKIELDLQNKNAATPELRSTKIIRLEKNDQSLIGEITKVEYLDNKYYVLDIRKQVFESLGNFIKKTKHGRGPGEVISPWCSTVDESRGHVLLWDQVLRRMSTYNLQLDYLDSYTNRNTSIWDFEIFSNESILTYTQNIDLSDSSTNKAYNYYYLKDSSGLSRSSYLPGDINLGNYLLRSPICKHGNRMLLITPFDFNIYSFEEEVLSPHIQVDFGQFKLDASMIERYGYEYHSLVEDDSKIVAMDYLMFSDQFLGFSYFQDGKRQFIIYNFSNSEIYYSQVLFDYGVLPEIKLQCLHGDNFIGFIDAGMYIEAAKANPSPFYTILDPDLNDNPYIISFSVR